MELDETVIEQLTCFGDCRMKVFSNNFFLDVAQCHMKGAPSETLTHSCWSGSLAC